MNNYAYTFIAIAVYLVTVAMVYYALYKGFTDTLTEIETNYRLSLSRACTSFVDAMNAVSKALDTDTEPESEPEQTLNAWAMTLCKSSGCKYFDGVSCMGDDAIPAGEKCPCDIDGVNK